MNKLERLGANVIEGIEKVGIKRAKKTKIIGKLGESFTVSLKKPKSMFPPTNPELNRVYKEVSSLCTTVQDPFYQITKLDEITDDPSFRGMEQYKQFLVADFRMAKNFVSKVESKDDKPKETPPIIAPVTYEGEQIGYNSVKIRQDSENLITISGEEIFKYPGKEREHHMTTIEACFDPKNPNNVIQATMEDHDLLSEKSIPLKFKLVNFPNPNSK